MGEERWARSVKGFVVDSTPPTHIQSALRRRLHRWNVFGICLGQIAGLEDGIPGASTSVSIVPFPPVCCSLSGASVPEVAGGIPGVHMIPAPSQLMKRLLFGQVSTLSGRVLGHSSRNHIKATLFEGLAPRAYQPGSQSCLPIA